MTNDYDKLKCNAWRTVKTQYRKAPRQAKSNIKKEEQDKVFTYLIHSSQHKRKSLA